MKKGEKWKKHSAFVLQWAIPEAVGTPEQRQGPRWAPSPDPHTASPYQAARAWNCICGHLYLDLFCTFIKMCPKAPEKPWEVIFWGLRTLKNFLYKWMAITSLLYISTVLAYKKFYRNALLLHSRGTCIQFGFCLLQFHSCDLDPTFNFYKDDLPTHDSIRATWGYEQGGDGEGVLSPLLT